MAVLCGVLISLILLKEVTALCAPTCEGVTEEGTNVIDPSDCQNFYTCVDEDGDDDLVPTLHQCPDGYYFNSSLTTIGCVPISSSQEDICQGYCNPCDVHCVEVGTLEPNPTNCSSYYLCLEDSNFVLAQCSDPQLKYFDYVEGRCGADSSKCFPYCDECKVYCLEQGVIADPADCHSYYFCDPPNTSHFTCRDEHVFDETAQDCVEGTCETLAQCIV